MLFHKITSHQARLLHSCKRAFTLVEVLLVLILTSLTLTLFMFLPSKSYSEAIELKQFQENLTSQLYFAQEKAVIQQSQISIIIRPYEAIQFYNNQRSETYLLLKPPNDWQIISHLNFHYNSLGRVNHFKTVAFQHLSGKRMYLVFQLGSGRFEFQK